MYRQLGNIKDVHMKTLEREREKKQLFFGFRDHTVPYRAIQCHTMPYNAIQCHTVPYNAIQCHTVPYNAIQCHRMPYSAIQCHRMPYSVSMEYTNAIYRFDTIRPSNTDR